jgi:hypothetical protein
MSPSTPGLRLGRGLASPPDALLEPDAASAAPEAFAAPPAAFACAARGGGRFAAGAVVLPPGDVSGFGAFWPEPDGLALHQRE